MATEVATLLFEADTRQLKSANDELDKTERAGIRAQDAAKKMGVELKKAANDSISPLQKASSGISALTSALVALGGALAVRQFVVYTDQWTDLNSRLINATGSAEAANQALQAISQTARTTYSSLAQTAEAFLLNSMALNEMGYTTRQQVELADALNNALVISGTKGERAASVMNALSKALALGKLSGENFNTVIQSGGRVVQALADGLGVTTSELRSMAADGLLTTEAVIVSMTSQLEILRTEAEEMPATIGDAMVQLGNFALEAVGKLDEAAGLSASIAETIIASLAGWRAAYMPTGQQQQIALLEERVALEERLALLMTPNNINRVRSNPEREQIRADIAAINERMDALSTANVNRQKDDHAAAAEGVVIRQEQRAAHEEELRQIEEAKLAKKAAAAEVSRIDSVNTKASSIADSLLSDEGQIQSSYERQRQTILDATIYTHDRKMELIRSLREAENAELAEFDAKRAETEKKANEDKLKVFFENARIENELINRNKQERIDASAQQTTQLLAFEDMLLKGKSESAKSALAIGTNLLNQEKRQAAGKIITDSYAAAMAAWKSLSGIPFIGPALGAAAAGGILAAGVSYSAKSLAGRALGGQVRGGESYVVGERGPEVLTMGSAGGKIIPNSALSSAQATGTINRTANVTFQITANDARGFDQMLNNSRGKIIDIINMALNENGQGALA